MSIYVPPALKRCTDVNLQALANGGLLQYDAATGLWDAITVAQLAAQLPGGMTFIANPAGTNLDLTAFANSAGFTIGPTGSGADQIWASLDGLNPSALLLCVQMQGTTAGFASTNMSYSFRARPTARAESAVTDPIADWTFPVSAGGNNTGVGIVLKGQAWVEWDSVNNTITCRPTRAGMNAPTSILLQLKAYL